MRIGDVLTKDDKLLLKCAAVHTGGDWLFIYREYLEIFSQHSIDEPCPYKKANKGRFAANEYLVKELEKRGVTHWREKMRNN